MCDEKITTAIKSRRFLENEKNWLYMYLQKEKKEKFEELETRFTELVQKYVRKYYDPDLLMLGEKEYCYSQDCVYISPEDLGLPVNYVDKNSGSSIEVGRIVNLGFGLPITKEKCGYSRDLDLSKFFTEKCTESELDLLKETLMNLAKARYEYVYYGYGTWIGHSWRKFKGIDTWGSLYSKSPEYFRLVSEKYMTNSDREELNSERSLLKKMKTVLGY